MVIAAVLSYKSIWEPRLESPQVIRPYERAFNVDYTTNFFCGFSTPASSYQTELLVDAQDHVSARHSPVEAKTARKTN